MPPSLTLVYAAAALGKDPSSIDWGPVAAWASAAIALLGLLFGVIALLVQVRRQWLLSAATTITAFEQRFVTDEWKEYRMNSALFISAHQRGQLVDLSEDVQVLGMFEHMAVLTRRKILDREMFWSKFGWYVIRYYEGLATGPRDLFVHIRLQEGDNTLWEGFEWLYGEMTKHYRRRGVALPAEDAPKRIEELLQQELRLVDYRTTRLRAANGRHREFLIHGIEPPTQGPIERWAERMRQWSRGRSGGPS